MSSRATRSFDDGKYGKCHPHYEIQSSSSFSPTALPLAEIYNSTVIQLQVFDLFASLHARMVAHGVSSDCPRDILRCLGPQENALLALPGG